MYYAIVTLLTLQSVKRPSNHSSNLHGIKKACQVHSPKQPSSSKQRSTR